MNELEKLIRAEIKTRGALPFDEYMALCLYHPEFGYYTTHDPLKDFSTSPEISQLFGEMIALWCVDVWMKLGSPTSFTLLEGGPGRGTLMADVLRTAKVVPPFMQAAQIIMLEKSPFLREKQREKLADYTVQWIDDLSELPEQPTILFCNELFDSFPIQRFMKTETGWKEQAIALIDNALDYVLIDSTARLSENEVSLNAPLYSIIETCAPAKTWVEQFATLIAAQGGAGLMIDYGYEGPMVMDSVQAIHDKKMSPVLRNVGKTDISANVDFGVLRQCAIAKGLKAYPLITQREFLMHCGVLQRAIMLKRHASMDQQKNIDESLHRLIAPDRMGDMFKVFCMGSASLPAPIGIKE